MATYEPDRLGVRRYLQHNPQLRLELHRRALLGLSAASAAAKRGKTHELASSGEVRDDGPNGGVQGDRMQFSIHFTSSHAVPATFPRRDPAARDYLLLALSVMERGR